MLVLRRNKNQEILIGNDIVIKLLGTGSGDKNVRIGIKAPQGIHISRGEITTKSKLPK